jgi:hypothetical protein
MEGGHNRRSKKTTVSAGVKNTGGRNKRSADSRNGKSGKQGQVGDRRKGIVK